MIAMQNLMLTELAIGFCDIALCLLKSFMIWIRAINIFFPLVIRYSTPLSVLAMTLMRLKMACCIAG